MSDAVDRLRTNPSGVASVLVTGIWLGALVLNADWWLAALLVGYVLVVPLVSMLFDPADEGDADESATSGEELATDHDAALQELKRRYARGELTDEQFERKLDALLRVETLEDVEDGRARDRDPAAGVQRDVERDAEPEKERDLGREPDLERE